MERRDLLTLVLSNLTGVEGYPITTKVAIFASSDVPGPAYQATISWGDGHVSKGLVAPDAGGFSIVGGNTYAVAGTYPITVTVAGAGGTTATGMAQATVGAVLPQAAGTTITPAVGQAFRGAVAFFTDAYPALKAADYAATVDWGDGHTSLGIISPNDLGGFAVIGTNTYAASGTRTVTVTIARILDNQTATATTRAIVLAPSLTALGTKITAPLDQTFTGSVASFFDANLQAKSTDYGASIIWGDGSSSAGTIVATGSGHFSVVGQHVYNSPTNKNDQPTPADKIVITVMIVRKADGQTAMATTTPVLVNQNDVLSGHLDPLSDTGVSSTDGITAINQPTFTGTAAPFAIVDVFGRRADQAQPVALGAAVVGASGLWHLPIGPLPDGLYTISASETPPAGQASLPVLLSPLLVDTASPGVSSVILSRQTGLVTVTLKDNLSGLDLTTALNPANYALLGATPFRVHPSSAALVPSAAVTPSDPVLISLQFPPAARLGASRRNTTLAIGPISDLAGNTLLNEYFRVSTTTSRPPAFHPSGRTIAAMRFARGR